GAIGFRGPGRQHGEGGTQGVEFAPVGAGGDAGAMPELAEPTPQRATGRTGRGRPRNQFRVRWGRIAHDQGWGRAVGRDDLAQGPAEMACADQGDGAVRDGARHGTTFTPGTTSGRELSTASWTWPAADDTRAGPARPGAVDVPDTSSCRCGQALPRMRFRLVPHTGHLAFAIRVPFSFTLTSPVASRFSLHFTQ